LEEQAPSHITGGGVGNCVLRRPGMVIMEALTSESMGGKPEVGIRR